MSTKIIVVSDNEEIIHMEKTIAEKNNYEFLSFSPKEWLLFEQKFQKEQEAKLNNIIQLPLGTNQSSFIFHNAKKDLIENMIEECNGNITLAAKKMQVSRSTLYRKMRALRIDNKEIRSFNSIIEIKSKLNIKKAA